MNEHPGFELPNVPRDPAVVIQMVHKLLEGGKSFQALLECERYLASLRRVVEDAALLKNYDGYLKSIERK